MRSAIRAAAPLACLLCLLGAVEVAAQPITIAWDRNREPEVTGYVVCYGVAPNVCDRNVDVGNQTTWTLTATAPGNTYYFKVLAYTANGVTSDWSEQVSETALGVPPSGPPFGQVDTPSQNAAGVVGSIGLTGWALDDGGIGSIKLYRNCLPFEPAANCQAIDGVSVVYLGDADIVPGARPDVEAAFRNYPQASRAGWGYLLLTNMLPHLPNQLPYGGQGSIRVYVLATDVAGTRQWLGRSTTDHTPTTITMANDTAVTPFGAIDTPGQGHTVTGLLWNFGWALTPDTGTPANPTGILVPTNGSTVRVWIDGAPMGTVGYNMCRGTVGSSPGPGVYCNDDVASIFGNAIPQPPYTDRDANPTKYRNLDAGRGAIGAFPLDTTTLTNGRHSIVWSVTDSSGRAEAIGSRYFTVLNSGSLEAASATSARVVSAAAALGSLPPATGQVWGRTGFDLEAPWETVIADAAGTRHVRVPERGRIELWVGVDVTEAYVSANGTLRPLPGGSRLANGRFTWAPPVGYIGTYDLVFVAGGEQIPVRVTIHPASERPGIDGYIDAPVSNATISGAFTVGGWAADAAAWTGSGIGAVHVWAHRRDALAFPVFLGTAAMNISRPDVAAQWGTQFDRAGWQLVAPSLPPGEYDVVAYFWSMRTRRFEDARVVRVAAR